MKLLTSTSLVLPLLLAACATAVTQDLADQEINEGGSAGSTSGGTSVADGGKSSSTGGTATAGKGGSPATNAFGGSASTAGTAGKSSGGAAGSTGSAGASHAGTGGSSSAGSGGSGSGGSGSGGKAGSGSGGASAGAAGTGTAGSVGTGSCTGTAKFMIDNPPVPTKYALGAKVVATCNGGTPCTLAKPAGQNGKSYEFSCTDQYNCGGQDPATTNWAQPPWQMTKACD